jgi:hypothetical protein
MKKQLFRYAAVLLTAGLFITACKKENTGADASSETEIKAQADDQERFAAETDDVTNDAYAALENSNTTLLGRPMGDTLFRRCDATVAVNVTGSPKTITITYNGNCLGDRTRTGTVVLTFADNFKWVEAGASFTVTYNNLTITRKRDGKSIVLNGTTTITNVSGGYLRDLATAAAPMVHEIKSNGLSITFDNGTQRVWKLAKRRTFTYNNGIVIAVSGISTEGDGIAEWGVNRFGRNFTTTIITPLTIKQSCNFRLVSGTVKHTVGNRTTTTTFGLDALGVPVATCAAVLYLKVEWVGANGATLTYIAPY